MRAELYRAEEPDRLVAAAAWRDARTVFESTDEDAVALLRRVFRPAPVPVDSSAFRPPGTTGLAVVEPGDIEWFRVAATVRGRAEGLDVRLVTGARGGWDPAMDPQTYGWGGRKPALPREP